MFQKTLIVCAVVAMAFTSCTKDEVVPTPAAPVKTKAEMLQSKPWRLTAWTGVMAGTTQSQDLFAMLLETCDHDDQYRFKAQGLLEYDQMAAMCSPEDPKIDTATWVYTSATNRLRFSASSFEVDAAVLQLNDTILQLQFSQSILGFDFEHVWTMKKY